MCYNVLPGSHKMSEKSKHEAVGGLEKTSDTHRNSSCMSLFFTAIRSHLCPVTFLTKNVRKATAGQGPVG